MKSYMSIKSQIIQKYIVKTIPEAVNKRLSELSSNINVFNTAKQPYENALLLSGYNYKMQYVKPNVQTPKRKRRRKILWFNPPFSENVKTNVGRIFLNLVKKHFNRDHRYKKIFNKNNIKVSYSCVENMGQIIKKHKKFLKNKS